MSSLKKIALWLFGPPSKFKVGDSVQLKSGDHLMIVIEVLKKRGMKQPLIHCTWYESHTKQNRCNLFLENHLIFFDWDSANKSKTHSARSIMQREPVLVERFKD